MVVGGAMAGATGRSRGAGGMGAFRNATSTGETEACKGRALTGPLAAVACAAAVDAVAGAEERTMNSHPCGVQKLLTLTLVNLSLVIALLFETMPPAHAQKS